MEILKQNQAQTLVMKMLNKWNKTSVKVHKTAIKTWTKITQKNLNMIIFLEFG
jgi:hypothetical protein